jgi:hypothetical protein
MASKTQKTEKIRARKHRSNKVNIKTDQKRFKKNLEVLLKSAEPAQS